LIYSDAQLTYKSGDVNIIYLRYRSFASYGLDEFFITDNIPCSID